MSLLMAGCMSVSAQHAAQGKYACIYEYDVKSADGNIDRGTTLLQIADAFAVFTDYSAFQLDSVARQPGASEAQRKEMEERVERNDHFFDQTVYQNDPSNRLTVHSVIAPYRYTYEEKINPIAWRLVDEEKEVCGYPCKKATGTYGGREWIAWYTPEVAVPFGPWKIVGLPGLVMAAEDAAGVHRFTAIQFRAASGPVVMGELPDEIKTTREKFIEAKNRFEQNPMANLPPEALSDMTIRKREGGQKSIFVNGVQLRMRANGYTPLEVE